MGGAGGWMVEGCAGRDVERGARAGTGVAGTREMSGERRGRGDLAAGMEGGGEEGRLRGGWGGGLEGGGVVRTWRVWRGGEVVVGDGSSSCRVGEGLSEESSASGDWNTGW